MKKPTRHGANKIYQEQPLLIREVTREISALQAPVEQKAHKLKMC